MDSRGVDAQQVRECKDWATWSRRTWRGVCIFGTPLLQTYHWTVLAALAVQACATSLELPPVAASPPAPAVGVPEAPPVAIPETISEPPDSPGDWVWIDGSWHYGLGRWVWTRGGWVNSPPGAAYFPGDVVYTSDGRILYWEPGWVDSDGRTVEAPPIEKPALTPKAERSVKGLL